MPKIDYKIMRETRRQLRDAEIYKQSSNHIDMFKPTLYIFGDITTELNNWPESLTKTGPTIYQPKTLKERLG